MFVIIQRNLLVCFIYNEFYSINDLIFIIRKLNIVRFYIHITVKIIFIEFEIIEMQFKGIYHNFIYKFNMFKHINEIEH